MQHTFYKYHGAGNDFIILDNRNASLQLSENIIQRLCHRQLGIGGDGLMLLQESHEADFEMIYYNADGKLGSMCGNGGRCIADFAFRILEMTKEKMHFLASDGIHDAQILSDGSVTLSMQDVTNISFSDGYTILNTGSPHYILPVENLKDYPVFEQGRSIRNEEEFLKEGINVNFVEEINGQLNIRTYERGVEDETLACGTGITAAAISSVGQKTGTFEETIKTKEGNVFIVRFNKNSTHSAQDIYLTGPVQFVFKGEINLNQF